MKVGECRLWQSGLLKTWIKLAGDEWHIAFESVSDSCGENQVVCGKVTAEPENMEWERWLCKDTGKVVQLCPMMPDRPVVVRPALPIHIVHGQEKQFFVSIPLWIGVMAGKTKTLSIGEKPSRPLSNTWFGEPVQGELCYSLNTSACGRIDAVEPKPLTAVCPIVVRNESRKPLNFERLCIRGEHLGIYEYGDSFITSQINVIYQGGLDFSKIRYGKKRPSISGAGVKVAEHRRPPENLVMKSFGNIMAQTFYG